VGPIGNEARRPGAVRGSRKERKLRGDEGGGQALQMGRSRRCNGGNGGEKIEEQRKETRPKGKIGKIAQESGGPKYKEGTEPHLQSQGLSEIVAG